MIDYKEEPGSEPATTPKLFAAIITLNPDNPVASNLQMTLSQEGIDAVLFPAVDGRQAMPALQPGERISQRLALMNRKAELTSSEVGCYLSHYRLVRQAFEQGYSHVCILEDDVVAEPGLGDVIRQIIALPELHHMVRLMSLKIRKRKKLQQLTDRYQLVRPCRGDLGTQGYILNRTGMHKVLTHGATIYMPIDKFFDSYFLYDMRCFTLEPHAIYELDNGSSISKTANRISKKLWVKLAWRSYKLYRSILRRVYFLRHRHELFPAEKPREPVGKSPRIRGY